VSTPDITGGNSGSPVVYDLVLLAGPSVEEQATDWSSFLAPGGMVVGPESFITSSEPPAVEGLPEPFAGFRAS